MKQYAPATQRNREAIAAVLAEELPDNGTVLEIASGSGEHAVHFARLFPHLFWQPSDADNMALASIAAWRTEAALPNLLAPALLNASNPKWPVDEADAIFCANMVHISPIAAAQGLLAGAGRILPPKAALIMYGPFVENDVEIAHSNSTFDQWLKARDPSFGIRRKEWLDRLATSEGLVRTRRVEMPANNLILVYRRS